MAIRPEYDRIFAAIDRYPRMGKDKLKRFAELANLPNTWQFPENMAGTWHEKVFGNRNPIILELACGRGEYTVNLARKFPEANFIGVDIKGSRIWRGARTAHEENLRNVAFLRTYIERIEYYFAPDEVSEIWITFPDPHPQPGKSKKRLSSLRFLTEYRKFVKDGGIIHLKTDDPLLYQFSLATSRSMQFPVVENLRNVHSERPGDPLLSILTSYEQRWIGEGKTIHYLSFQLDHARFNTHNLAQASREMAEWQRLNNPPRPARDPMTETSSQK